MKPEEEYRSRIDQWFTKYFDMDQEVWSTERRRIDYVLRCKASSALFGVEVKHDAHMRGIAMGEYLLQAHDYSRMQWKTKFMTDPVKLMIFITPALSNTVKQIIPESKIILDRKYVDGVQTNQPCEYYQSFHQSIHTHSNITSWISAFGIGEIRNIDGIVYFMFNNFQIWASKVKPYLHEKNYKFYTSKL